MARLQSREIFYWRDKRGREVDFVLASRRREPLAIECKWSVDGFEEAVSVFADPLALYSENPSHPERTRVIGASARPRLLFCVFVERDENEFRIISARKVTAHERRRYEEGTEA